MVNMDKLEQLAKTLRKRGFTVEVFPPSAPAAQRVVAMISGHTVGLGGSLTAEQMGLVEAMRARASKLFRHFPGGAGDDERNALVADFYVASANAISLDGHIVNTDGTGNRVAATCFGPKHVIYLVGRNKVTKTLAEAMERAKAAAVAVVKRYKRKTPCATTGKCEDCLSPDCVCSVTAIHRKRPTGVEVSVFLIDEDLGL